MCRKIKKYQNRKFYDIAGARYISMADLAEIVYGEEEVKAIDDRTGKDITVETLARALYERIKRYFAASRSAKSYPMDPFSRRVLMDLIRQVPLKPPSKRVRSNGGIVCQ